MEPMEKTTANKRPSKLLRACLFNSHTEIVGESLHSRYDYTIFTAEDIAHFRAMHEYTTAVFARTFLALATGNSALAAAALWEDMETSIRVHFCMEVMANGNIEQKHLDNGVCRFSVHLYHQYCRDK